MAGRGGAARWLEALEGDGAAAGLGDAELLRRFLDAPGASGEAAFEAIVRRHGPAVLGLCRGVARDEHDAEDAFQATFLVLARRAATVRDPDRLAPWLARTARRIAVRARRASARRRAREGAALDLDAGTERAPGAAAAAAEVASAVRAEVDRLPEPDRTLLRLTYWHGRSYEEAAEAVARPIGTVRSRLARARDRLRERLARRGIGATSAAAARPSEALIVKTARLAGSTRAATAAGTVPAAVAALAEGELAMTTIRRGVLAAGLLVGGTAAGALALSPPHAVDAPAPAAVETPKGGEEGEAKVPLRNADLEDGSEGEPEAWERGGAVPGVEYSWSREAAHGGKGSLALTKTAHRYFPIAQWAQEAPRRGDAPRLRVAAWVKADKTTKAILDVQFLDEAGGWSHAWAAYIGPKDTDAPPVSHGWRRYEGVVAIPPGTKTLVVAGQIYGPGAVGFDDFEASYTEAPAIDPLATAAE